MMRNHHLTVILATILAVAAIPKNVVAQTCGCASNFCCNRHGYCGTGNVYCGQGCRAGPFFATATPSGSSSVSVANIVTPAFFNSIIKQAASSCAKKSFYARSAFLSALNSYPQFGKIGASDDYKLEIAAFFAHVTHRTERPPYGLWYWMTNVQSVIGQGFGATIRAIDGRLECDGANPATVQSRVQYYTEYCTQIGVAHGDNPTC